MAATITGLIGRADGFQLAFNNPGAGGTLYYHELNRSQDFASDDTLLCPFYSDAGANLHDIIGIPSGTPFWVRTRAADGGAYSNVVLGATAAVPVADYGGFSIDKALIVAPASITGLQCSFEPNTIELGGFPSRNLLRDDPGTTWQAGSFVGPVGAHLNWRTSGEPIDTIAMLGTMANDDATYVLHHSTDGQFDTASDTVSSGVFRASPTVGRRRSYHSLIQLAQPTTDSFWRLTVQTPARHFMARNLIIGLARRSINASRGNGSALSDLGAATRTRFGAIDRVSGWRGRVIDFSLSWLREAEYHAKYADLAGLVGRTDPVLAVPNSKQNVHLNDRIAFGPITESREETQSGRHYSKSFTIDSLY